MIDKRYWNPFLAGCRENSIKMLIRQEGWTPEKATQEYDEFRKKVMKSNAFYLECEEAPRDKKIEYRVMEREKKFRATDEEVRDMYLGGMSYMEISFETGYETAKISNILKSFGVKGRHKQKSMCDDYIDTIVQMKSDGYPVVDIAKRINLKYKTVLNYMRKKGI